MLFSFFKNFLLQYHLLKYCQYQNIFSFLLLFLFFNRIYYEIVLLTTFLIVLGTQYNRLYVVYRTTSPVFEVPVKEVRGKSEKGIAANLKL